MGKAPEKRPISGKPEIGASRRMAASSEQALALRDALAGATAGFSGWGRNRRRNVTETNRYGPTAARPQGRPGREVRPKSLTLDIHSHVAVPAAAAIAGPHV